MYDTLFRTMDRQGMLKGDLNILQRTGLVWLMGEEIKEQSELERMRLEMNALASNPHTSGELIKQLSSSRVEEETRFLHESEEVWVTPTSTDELEDLLNQIV